MPTITITSIILLLFITLFTTILATTPHRHNYHRRHLLHQPFFPPSTPTTTISPSPSPSPSPQPSLSSKQQPKQPFSSTSSTPATTTTQNPFFPTYPSPPPPPSPNALATFPANISSLLVPHTTTVTSSSHRHLIAISVSTSLLLLALLSAFAAFLYYRKYTHNTTTDEKASLSVSDSVHLYPPHLATSDGTRKPRSSSLPSHSNSSEFLYLGTLPDSRAPNDETVLNSSTLQNSAITHLPPSTQYHKLGSPELKPLPPLPKHNFGPTYRNAEMGSSGNEEEEEEEEEEFFSPRGSSGRKDQSPVLNGSSSQRVFNVENFGSRSFNSRTPSYPCSNSASPASSVSNSVSPALNFSPASLKSKSPDSVISFPAPGMGQFPGSAPFRPILTSLPPLSLSASSSERGSGNTLNSPARNSDVSGQSSKQSPRMIRSVSNRFVLKKLPPPPPPMPPPRYWEAPAAPRLSREPNLGPPVLVPPTRPVVLQNLAPMSGTEQPQSNEILERHEETPRPKLKPLHWDKVRASSDRAMVWDQLKSSSFQLNEEMIETLFMVNNGNSNMTLKDNGRRLVLPLLSQENRVLDPKKSQNIAILLRALNVTIEEVCEGLLEGNSDTLGTELLESLLKMAPTKEEERKLKEFKDESPFKLGPAEKFLKAVLDIPFAFKRVDAMLYIANFDSEVEYLRRSFETLEVACEELKNSRMFMKLLEAVLKTGNRMNVGTNRGDAHAFKLDTLLKLVDIKGTDGKTTLLHFVVQEIIRTEGSRLSGANQSQLAEKSQQSALRDEVEFRKLGLQVVSGLSGELTNVKKAAAMDSDVLGNEVAKLAEGISKISEVVKLNEELALKETSRKFSESMNVFLKKAGEEIVKIQAQEKVALSLVKEITEYFHGNSAKEEAHPFRIFLVVRDFLSTLDQVCKEVGKVNERTTVGSARQFPMPVNPTLPPVFPEFNGRQHYGSSDDESSSSL